METRHLPMLALVGSGEYLPTIAPLDCALIRRLAAPVRMVCLPTAAGSIVGSRLMTTRLSSIQLKRIVGVLLWLIAAKMIGDLFSLPALK